MSPAWQARTDDPSVLTRVLHAAGVLTAGQVRSIDIESTSTKLVSKVMRLRLAYDGEAASAPDTIILKTGHPQRTTIGWLRGRQEVAFYQRVAPIARGRYAPRCYEAHADVVNEDWHVLLEDLTDTHATVSEWPLPPSMPTCQRLVEAHAGHQAIYWDHACLDELTETWRWRDAASARMHVERLSAQVAQLSDRLGDRLPGERLDLLHRVLDAAPRLTERFRTRRHLTVVQGDAHVWNCFLPRPEIGEPKLFDWDSWRIDVGASDVAHMMTVHWYPDRRRLHERHLLDRFHAALVANGVGGYDRRALDDDYRLSVLWQLMWPVSQAAGGIPPVIWWNNLERVMLAFDDLGCNDLLR